MITKEKIANFTFSLGMILFFFSSIITMTINYENLRYPMLIVGMALILFSNLIFNKVSLKITLNWTDIIFIFIFFPSMVTSSIINMDLDLLIRAFIYFSTYAIFNLMKNDLKRLPIRSFLFVLAIMLIYSITKYPLKMSLYEGPFKNQNNLGMVGAFGTILSVVIIGAKLFKDNTKNKVISLLDSIALIGYFLIFFFFTIISGSRSSLLLVFVAFVLLFFYWSRKYPNNIFKVAISLLAIVFIAVIFIYPTSRNYLVSFVNEHIFNKWGENSSDFLSGRTNIWKTTILETNFFGHGKDYFIINTNGVGAHNLYISLLGEYGIIPALSFFAFVLSVIINSLRKYRKYNDTQAFIVLMFSVSFFIGSMFELMIFSPFMYALFLVAHRLKNNANN